MQRYAKITKKIVDLVKVIAEGRVVAFPTGTSYGLAVDALQGNALQRLRNVKGRSQNKTFTVFMRDDLWDTYLNLTEEEKSFLHKHTGKPLTLLVQAKESLSHLTQNGLIGLRVIDHPVMQELSQHVDVPLTATSANITDEPACSDVTCVVQSFPGLLNPDDTRHGDMTRAGHTTYDLSLGAIYDAGQLPTAKPSTIMRLQTKGSPEILREGGFVA